MSKNDSGSKTIPVSNQPYDEEVVLSDEEEGTQQETNDDQQSKPRKEDEVKFYNALEYKNLEVSNEIKELFQYIGRYKPHNIELDTVLKPFIPDYIPATGDVDEFIKIPRPDGKPDYLGLKVLSEPGVKQSDPSILTLQLKQATKQANIRTDALIGKIEYGDQSMSKRIDDWINNITKIQEEQPPAQITYRNKMPDIETLMQEWPPEMEESITNMLLPSGDLDMSLDILAKLTCNMLDIPMYQNPIESLHVMFQLYLEFKNNPLFKSPNQQTFVVQ